MPCSADSDGQAGVVRPIASSGDEAARRRPGFPATLPHALETGTASQADVIR